MEFQQFHPDRLRTCFIEFITHCMVYTTVHIPTNIIRLASLFQYLYGLLFFDIFILMSQWRPHDWQTRMEGHDQRPRLRGQRSRYKRTSCERPVIRKLIHFVYRRVCIGVGSVEFSRKDSMTQEKWCGMVGKIYFSAREMISSLQKDVESSIRILSSWEMMWSAEK